MASQSAALGSGWNGQVALPFDNGPGRWIERIVATFDQRVCKATFLASDTAVTNAPMGHPGLSRPDTTSAVTFGT